MSILDTQNINNLQEGFGRVANNPFPVQSDQTADVFWNGYEYAPPGLGTAFAATTAEDRLTPVGEETINGSAGESSYGPAVRMSEGQSSILTAMANMINSFQQHSSMSFATEAGPKQMKNTFASSDALKSARQTTRVSGTDITTSGVAVPQFTPIYQYGVPSSSPLIEATATVNDDGSVNLDINVDGQPHVATAGDLGLGDWNDDGVSNYADFFIMMDQSESVTNEDGSTTVTSGGAGGPNMSNKGLSTSIGIQTIVSNDVLDIS